MITLLALILRLALLAVFTFGFVVLYEHGPAKFSAGAKMEWSALRTLAAKEKSSEPAPAPAHTPEPPPPDPAATPVSTPVPPPVPIPTPTPAPSVAPTPSSIGAWDALQKQPIGEGMDIPVAGKAGDPPPKSGVNQ